MQQYDWNIARGDIKQQQQIIIIVIDKFIQMNALGLWGSICNRMQWGETVRSVIEM